VAKCYIHLLLRWGESWVNPKGVYRLAMDFVHDQLATRRKRRVLTIIDIFSHFSPAIEPRFTFRGPDVVVILKEAGQHVEFPKVNPGRPSHQVRFPAIRPVGITLDFSKHGRCR
jgi:putative transposase